MPDSRDLVRNRSSANKKAAANSRGSRMTAGCPVAAARTVARRSNYSGGCRCSWALETATECCCFADCRCVPKADDRYNRELSSGPTR